MGHTDLGYRILYRNRAVVLLVILLDDSVDAEGKEKGQRVDGIEPARAFTIGKAHGEAGVQHQGYDGVHGAGFKLHNANSKLEREDKTRSHVRASHGQWLVNCRIK